jgi:hypothetical protein
MMHAFEHGVVVYVLKAFVDEISGPKCKEMDRLAREMFADHRSSEKDTYPRTNFTKGVTHLKLMKCYEWPGFLLVYMILAQSYKGSAILKNRMDDNPTKFAQRVKKHKMKANKKIRNQKYCAALDIMQVLTAFVTTLILVARMRQIVIHLQVAICQLPLMLPLKRMGSPGALHKH